MSIVRSLLISVGFVTDKKTVTQTNRAIEGFKTRFSIAASAAAFAFSKVLNFFGDIASAVIDADDLAKTLGLSLSEFKALQQAASNFGFRKNNIADALKITDKMIFDAKRGMGDLHKAARLLKINFDPNGSAKETLITFLRGLSDIKNEQDRIKVSAMFFGDNLAKSVSDLSQNIDQFVSSAKELEEISSTTEKDISTVKKLEISIINLGIAWKKTFEEITQAIAPFLTSITDSLTQLADLKNNFFGLKTTSEKDFLDSINDFLFGDFKKIGDKITEWQEKSLPFTTNQTPLAIDQLSPNSSNINNGGIVSITNNFEINNPPGTSDEQSLSTWQKIKNDLVATFNDAFRDIQNNNPVDE